MFSKFWVLKYCSFHEMILMKDLFWVAKSSFVLTFIPYQKKVTITIHIYIFNFTSIFIYIFKLIIKHEYI